jgi:hypothetical protein
MRDPEAVPGGPTFYSLKSVFFLRTKSCWEKLYPQHNFLRVVGISTDEVIYKTVRIETNISEFGGKKKLCLDRP